VNDSQQHDRRPPPTRSAGAPTAEQGPHHASVRYERSDVSFWGLFWFAAGLCTTNLKHRELFHTLVKRRGR